MGSLRSANSIYYPSTVKFLSTCTANGHMHMYAYVCVGSHCWFFALLQYSFPSQHPLDCDSSGIQVDCKLL